MSRSTSRRLRRLLKHPSIVLPAIRARLLRALTPANPSSQKAFYTQVDTCQIPSLWFLLERFFGKKTEGTFVEIGGYDGYTFSNTWGLAERDWSGLIVEPLPELAAACRVKHAEHNGISVIESAVGAPGQSSITLYRGDSLTTANKDQFAEYASVEWARPTLTNESVTVQCQTLDELLVTHSIPAGFEVLVVDVEGFESAVFGGFTLDRWQPQMLIVELADLHPDLQLMSSQDAELGDSILSHGYRIVYKDHINTVYVRQDLWNERVRLTSG